MTNAFENDPDGYTQADFDHNGDPVLVALRAAFVDDGEEGGGSFGVTLSASGSVFSGTLVSAEAWAAVYKEALTDTGRATETAVGQAVAQALTERSAEWRETAARRKAAGLPTPGAGVICLQDAYLLGGSVPVKLGLVRVLASEVDAWSPVRVSPAVE